MKNDKDEISEDLGQLVLGGTRGLESANWIYVGGVQESDRLGR